MRQRALIAMAIACRPQLLIADEPTTALDVTVQAQVVLLAQPTPQRASNSAILLPVLTHNLDLMAELCDRVAVMYAGDDRRGGFSRGSVHYAVHPYTNALMRCIPRLSKETVELESIEGNPPAIESTFAGMPISAAVPARSGHLSAGSRRPSRRRAGIA